MKLISLRLIALLTFFVSTSQLSYAQCTVTTNKTDVTTCNGGTNGVVGVTIVGNGVNNCTTAPTTTETCLAATCSTSVATNSAVTVTTGKTCLTYSGSFTQSIYVSGGTLVICGNATPSSFTFTGGTIIINGSLTLNGGLMMYAGTTLKNYGTLTVSTSASISGALTNNGTMNVNSGTPQVETGGSFINNKTLTIASGLNVVGTFTNNNTATVNGNFQGYNGSVMTNNCTFNVGGNFTNSTTAFNNNGKTTITGTLTQYSGTSISMQSGSSLTTGTLMLQGGAINISGTNCASLKVTGNATIYAGTTVSTLVSVCVSGTTNNYAGLGTNVLNCNCNISSPVCNNYSWTNSAGTVVGTTASVTGLPAGTYYYSVSCPSCSSTALTGNVVVGQPSAITFTYTQTNASCTANNGSISVTATGGTGALQYSKDDGVTFQTSSSFTGLAAGTYKVKVKDANNCVTTSQNVVITQPTAISFTTTKTNVTCNAGTDGSIVVSVTGVVGTEQYSKDNGTTYQSSNTFTGLAAGTYSIVVKTVDGCISTAQSVSITAPAIVSFTYTSLNVKCFGASTGSITVTTSATTPQYSIDNGLSFQSSNVFNNLSAGSYQIIVKDVNGCLSSAQSISLTQPSQLNVSYVKTDASCNGSTNGSISLTVSGGVLPYAILWNNGSTGANLSNISAGTYTATVTDNNTCVQATTVTITEPAALDAVVTKTDVTVYGQSDGTATIVVNNPPTPTNPIAANCTTPLPSNESCSTGCTSVISTDVSALVVNNGDRVCLTASSYTNAITINGGTLVICGTVSPSTLTFNSGTLVVNGSLTLVSALNLGTTCTLNNFGTISVSGGIVVQNTFNNNGTVNVTTGDFQVNSSGGNFVNNAQLTISSGSYTNNGTTVNGGTINISSNLNANNASAFTNNCTVSVGNNFTNNTTFNNYGSLTVTTTNNLNGGSILNMYPGSQLTTTNLSLIGTLNGAGTGGCSSVKISGNTTINGGATISGNVSICDANGVESNNLSGSTAFVNCNCNLINPACTYLWSNGETTSSVNDLAAGTYTVTATCSGCSITKQVTITQHAYIIINTVNVNPGSFTVDAPGITQITENSGLSTSEVTIAPDLPAVGTFNDVIITIAAGTDNQPLELKVSYSDHSKITDVKAKFGTNYLDVNQDYYTVTNNKILFYNEKPQANPFVITNNLQNGVLLDPVSKLFTVSVPSNTIFTSSLLSVSKINSATPSTVYGPSSTLSWDASAAVPGVYEFQLQLTSSTGTKTYKGQFMIK